ncbi:MAG: ATP-dependent DNA helicase RecG [Geminicoccaceae bacterium]|nr:ATP-dependent DNA helicase RecG [Geminicoccaceae bacterium]
MSLPAKRSDAVPVSAGDGTAVLFAPLSELPGVGPVLEAALARLAGRPKPRLIDLLFLAPRGWLDPRPLAEPGLAPDGATVALAVEIAGPPRGGGGRSWRVPVRAGAHPGELVWFHGGGAWLSRRFPVGARRLLVGRITFRGGRFALAHPTVLPESLLASPRPLPVYPLVRGLSLARLRRVVATALARLPDLPEWLGPSAAGRPSFAQALRRLHGSSPVDTPSLEAARRRLALDELVSFQLAFALERRRRAQRPARPTRGDGRLVTAFLSSLPFSPTADQRAAFRAIVADLARPHPTARLLMGDVGSGKTLVAALALLVVAEAGRQGALLAPTELLARQHHATLSRWFAPLGLEPALLVGGEPARARAHALERLASGNATVVVGTHALIEPAVRFADLALAVVDEQHRFGVHQRLALLDKGAGVDLLLLSATPIPRTLRLAGLGALEVSELRTKPPGREPVDTRLVSSRRLDEVVAACGRALARGERIYWICPAIEDEDGAEGAAARARFEALARRFGARVGLAHGRQSAKEREAAMRAFARGEIALLVATTVVEVGVDVPEASVIVIERAERFGLAQLHQLRGRVGRGARPATCLLLYDERAGAQARARLSVLRRTRDGFAIAEADLATRGPGDLLGARQSGLPLFRFADLSRDGDLVHEARAIAADALVADPELRGTRGRALRELLRLFDREAALGLLAAG